MGKYIKGDVRAEGVYTDRRPPEERDRYHSQHACREYGCPLSPEHVTVEVPTYDRKGKKAEVPGVLTPAAPPLFLFRPLCGRPPCSVSGGYTETHIQVSP